MTVSSSSNEWPELVESFFLVWEYDILYRDLFCLNMYCVTNIDKAVGRPVIGTPHVSLVSSTRAFAFIETLPCNAVQRPQMPGKKAASVSPNHRFSFPRSFGTIKGSSKVIKSMRYALDISWFSVQ